MKPLSTKKRSHTSGTPALNALSKGMWPVRLAKINCVWNITTSRAAIALSISNECSFARPFRCAGQGSFMDRPRASSGIALTIVCPQ